MLQINKIQCEECGHSMDFFGQWFLDGVPVKDKWVWRCRQCWSSEVMDSKDISKYVSGLFI